VNRYLTRLRALNLKTGLPRQPSKLSKPSYEGFEGDQGMPVLKNETSKADTDLIKNPENRIPRQPSKPSKPDSPLAEVELICAQCGGGVGTNPPTDAPTIPIVWLHPECCRFWICDHPQYRRPE
jgi:hypothetical protein